MTFYEKIYDILVDLGGASKSMKGDFVRYFTTQTASTLEWRFQGNLGFGGKFWRTSRGHDVNCYSEDLDPRRAKIIEQINQKLGELQ